MRRASTAAAIATLALAVAAPSAQADTCIGGGADVTCQELLDCYMVGATLFLTATPADAVAYYRRCMALDRRYRLHQHGDGEHRHTRKRRLRVTRSTFWPLYCEAQRRAGNTDDPICRIEDTSGGGGSGGGGGGGTREPHFTG